MTMPETLTVARGLVYAKTSTAPFIIRDTNDNIAANADELVALGQQIVSLQGDNSFFFPQLNVADLLVLQTKTYYDGSLEKFTTINDTAAHVAANAVALKMLAAGLAHFNNGLSITISDSAVHVAANRIALRSLAAVLSKDIYHPGYFNNNSLTLIISDKVADVAANTTALQSLAAGLAQDSYYSGLFNNNRFTVNISDTAANFAVHSAVLQSLAAGLASDTYNDGYSNVTALTLTVSDTAAQVASYADALQKLAADLAQDVYHSGRSNNIHFTLTVSDSAAHVAANVNALNALAAQLAQDTYGSSFIQNNNRLTLSVNDTAAQIVASAVGLQKLAAELAQDAVNNGNSNNSSLILIIRDTATHAAAHAAALNALAAGLANDTYNQGNTNISSLTVIISDSAAHVAANTIALRVLAAGLSQDTYGSYFIRNNNYLSIIIRDTASHVVSNAAALQTLATALEKDIFGAGFDNNTLAITIADTFNNIISDAHNINALLVPIGGIKLTDSGMPKASLTADQYAADATVLAEIRTPYRLTLSGEKAANVAADIKNGHVLAITVVDTAANVVAVLDTALMPNSAKLSNIALTDSIMPILLITAKQFAHDAVVLDKIITPYGIDISGEVAANVATDIKNSHVTAIAVVDNAAHVSASLSGLAGNIYKISGITLTNKATPTISLAAAQVTNDLGALNLINSPYMLSVKDTLINISSLALGGVHNHQIELMPTSLVGTLFETSQINALNLSQIKLNGDTIMEKVYHGNGTEFDIMDGNVSMVGQLFFTHNSESQLQLLGLGKTVVHVM